MRKSKISVKVARGKNDIQKAFKIREEVFIKGQNVPLGRERDKYDKIATHFLVFESSKAIGAARVRFVARKTKIERMAVLEKYRGKGIGKKLLKFIISYVKKDANNLVLGAQCHAIGFYKKLGFKEKGKVYADAGIKHKEMLLKLGK